MAIADRLIDRMLGQSDPETLLNQRMLRSFSYQNDADALTKVSRTMDELTTGDREINPVIKASLEKLAGKIVE